MIEKLKSNKKLTRLLTILLFILLCCNLPSLLFFPLCSKEDLFRPPNTEVLVSACKKPVVRGVPGGEVLFVHENLTDKTYLLDLRTGEKRKVPDDPLLLDKGIFLNSDLVWLEGSLVGPENPNYRPHYILDLTDGKRYELVDLNLLPRLEHGIFDSENYVYIQNASQVYIHHSKNTLIAISSDFHTNQNSRIIFSGYAIGSERGDLLEQLLKNLSMDYEIIDFSLYNTDIPSPTNKYITRFDGLYFSETNQLALAKTGMFGYFKSWFYDESGVIVQNGGEYLITLPGVSNIYYIPSPVLKLLLHSP